MAAAMKIIIQRFLRLHPDISVMGLATTAVDDHIIKNGCEFEQDAVARAVEQLGVSPAMKAADLPSSEVARLGDILETMESNCPHKHSNEAPV